MKITATAPCRVDLAGGTLDIWPLYLYHDNAVTVNFAVNRYTHCEISTRPGDREEFRSVDLKIDEQYASPGEMLAAKHPRLPLAVWITRFFRPPGGFCVTTDSEAPAGAGISGSSALLIAIASALNRWTNARHGIEKLREICQNVEAQIIRVPTGAQDYYPAMYGGVSAIELSPAGVRRVALPVETTELNRRIVLAYTGAPRNSGINNWEVTKAHIDGDRGVFRNFERIAAIANGMRAALEKADWTEAARLLREEWSHRRRNAPGITTPLIDRLIAVTRRAGSTGAKVCGAGGGGCVLFLAEPEAKAKVAAAIAREGATVLPVEVAPRGVRVKVER